ncbi:hypothetical protein DL764_008675 [Monosporascus ibericus]|uniref:Uncharacterized protein n=1 Tax=Monosporascus ibericus TaxID=155417 RepID=A0A4Q4SWW3_9PEZI|nr:hypothetical protein DL764_008675 [Monosporascus ibericus]
MKCITHAQLQLSARSTSPTPFHAATFGYAQTGRCLRIPDDGSADHRHVVGDERADGHTPLDPVDERHQDIVPRVPSNPGTECVRLPKTGAWYAPPNAHGAPTSVNPQRCIPGTRK